MNSTRANIREKTSPIFQKLKMVSNSLDQTQKLSSETSFESLDLQTQDGFLNETDLDVRNQKNTNLNLTSVENKPALLNGYSKLQELKLVKIGLASSDRIREWAEKQLPNKKVFGEVLNANTLHYKTFKPHKGGLFCERIFGPLKDFECACGIKQKPNNHETFIQNLLDSKKDRRQYCPNCDVEYTWSLVRRYQLGYIQLVSPVTHLWYLRTNPSYLSLLLDLRKRELESIIYCMQITTLEYYWKPMHSLQMNLTPASLFESYQKYLNLNSLEAKENQKLTLEEQKRKIRLNNQKNIQIIRYGNYPMSQTQKLIPSVETSSLEAQMDYLEKSYQLTSPTTSLPKSSKITNFLKQKVAKNVKKRSFLMVKETIAKSFYLENYRILRQRLFFTRREMVKQQLKNMDKSWTSPSQLTISGDKNDLSNYPIHTILLAYELQKNLEKKKNYRNQKHFYETKLFQTIDMELKTEEKNSLKNSMSQMTHSSVFLTKFIKLIESSGRQKKWTSLLKNQERRLQPNGNFLNSVFLEKNRKVFPTFRMSLNHFSIQQFVQNSLLLYLLVKIEENQDSFLKDEPLNLKENQILMKILCESISQDAMKFNDSSELENGLKNWSEKNVEFLSKFLQPNFLMPTTTENLEFYELQNSFKKHSNLMKVFNPLFNKMTEFLFNGSVQMTPKLLTQKYSNAPITGYPLLGLNFSDVKKVQLVKEKTNPSFLAEVDFHKLCLQKKVTQFLKNTDSYITTNHLFTKNGQNLLRNLTKSKQNHLNQSIRMVNNIYTVSYSKGWESEKDWKYFLYYNTAPIELSDKLIMNYQYRFLSTLSSSVSSPIPIIGANLIEKLLLEYEGMELKKMAVHYQNILPKLNRYIRSEKQLASKKSDYMQIQRLLEKRDSIIRRLKLLRKIFKKNTKPSSMVLKTLPVLPPDLRPILKMQNQIAASDLNRFYQRILYRNDRLKKFLRMNTSILNSEPGFEIKYAQRLLQESVDNLIQNGKGQVKPETNSRGQPLKSLSEILKGKQGRFRQYLLGKRVDYSGRSVIVVGPTLKIYECGLPFEMAMELFLPFLIKRIFQYNYARTVIGAKTLLQTQKTLTWELLEEVMKNHPVLLNRAPTLHRLGIQAFQPKLIEGRAILLHPLVCPAFNADFDGDQMAVHVPITVEARTEAWKLMFSRNHLTSPATGEPMLLPSQDMVLGCYYLTTEVSQYPRFHYARPFRSGTGFYFSNLTQVLQAYLQERIHLQTPIWIRWNGFLQMETQNSEPLEIRIENNGNFMELRPKMHRVFNRDNVLMNSFIRTTAGRVLFNSLIENCLQNG